MENPSGGGGPSKLRRTLGGPVAPPMPGEDLARQLRFDDREDLDLEAELCPLEARRGVLRADRRRERRYVPFADGRRRFLP